MNNRLTDKITFYQACFMSGMSSDTYEFLNKTLTDTQKLGFIENERETITDEGYESAVFELYCIQGNKS